jgi:UDP-N-acetylglucosamine acyltransferase
MSAIDPTARIEPGAVIGQGVSIGPYCVIRPNVVLGDDCRLVAHVHLDGHTAVGTRTVIHPFVSLGSPPQSVHYRGEPTRLVIGADCDIREGVTMSTGTAQDGGVTRVGDRCFFMAGSHVAHDCQVGNDVTFANNAVLAGHVTVEDHVFVAGQAAVHQFVRIGEGAMIGGMSGIGGDVIPFGFVFGTRAKLVGLNVVGLKRRGQSREDMHSVRRAYRSLFLGAGEFRQRLETVAAEFAGNPLVDKIVAFIRAGGSRPLLMSERARDGEPLEANPVP